MICPKCGAQNMDGVSFCGSCGAQMASNASFRTEEPKQNAGYYQQQPFQQPQPPLYGYNQPGGYANNAMIPPKNWMTESVIVTVISFICCCSPISTILGIIAIVKANSVNSEYNQGNFNEANKNANSAKNLTMWAAIISVVYLLLGMLIYYLFIAALISQAGGMTEFLESIK